MKSLLIAIPILITISGCAGDYMNKKDQYNRSPSGFTEIINSKRLMKMKPVQVIQLLKASCCDAIMIQPTKITSWTKEDIEALAPYLKDTSDSSPVASTASNVSCRGARYVSTVQREVEHLIKAYKEKKYPLAQCSTYDFRMDSEQE